MTYKKKLEELSKIPQVVHGGKKNSEDKLDFSSNINPYGPPKILIDLLNANITKNEISEYPDNSLISLKKSLAEYVGVNQNQIIPTNGSLEFIKLFADTFVEPKSEVIIPSPSFGEYEKLVLIKGGIPTSVSLKKGQINIDEILRKINDRTSCIFLTNPNNPYGSVVKKKGLIDLVEILNKKDIPILIDEAFIEFSEENSLVSLTNSFDNLIVSRSLTKIIGVAGIRLGFGVSSERVSKVLDNMRLTWNINAFAKIIGENILKCNDFINETILSISKEREFLFERLKALELKVYPSNANFLFIEIDDSPNIKSQLYEKGILVRDCSSFRGIDSGIRIAVRTRKENEILIGALAELLHG